MRKKIILIESVVLLLVCSFLGWRYYENKKLMQIRFDSPPTTKTTQVEAKTINQPTYSELLHYRKQALAANLDKYPNGYLVISSINVRLPIYNRANNKTLSLGVGKSYFLDSKMGQGNFVLAGHNMLRKNVLNKKNIWI